MIHIIVNRFCMTLYWKEPIYTEKCEPQFALYYLGVTALDFVTVYTHTVNNEDHCKMQL